MKLLLRNKLFKLLKTSGNAKLQSLLLKKNCKYDVFKNRTAETLEIYARRYHLNAKNRSLEGFKDLIVELKKVAEPGIRIHGLSGVDFDITIFTDENVSSLLGYILFDAEELKRLEFEGLQKTIKISSFRGLEKSLEGANSDNVSGFELQKKQDTKIFQETYRRRLEWSKKTKQRLDGLKELLAVLENYKGRADFHHFKFKDDIYMVLTDSNSFQVLGFIKIDDKEQKWEKWESWRRY